LEVLGRTLPPPLNSFPDLVGFVRAECRCLAARRKIVFPEYFSDPPSTTLILRGIGYLSETPLLRILIFHYVVKTSMFDEAFEVLDRLRRDITRVRIGLESTLRQCLFEATTVQSCAARCQSIRTACFTVALRNICENKLHLLKHTGPRPALLIVPSSIAVAGFGLYLRGSIDEKTKILGYCGELEDADTDGSGYRMKYMRSEVIDARVERCLCSMMNDAKSSVFRNNVRFSTSFVDWRTTAETITRVEDEELFVGYGSEFRFDLEATAAGFSRSLAADFAAMSQSATLPRLV
jgi:hypothetical protein